MKNSSDSLFDARNIRTLYAQEQDYTSTEDFVKYPTVEKNLFVSEKCHDNEKSVISHLIYRLRDKKSVQKE